MREPKEPLSPPPPPEPPTVEMILALPRPPPTLVIVVKPVPEIELSEPAVGATPAVPADPPAPTVMVYVTPLVTEKAFSKTPPPPVLSPLMLDR